MIQEDPRAPKENVLGSTRFQLVRQLGSGGMGVVYEAIDRESGSVVAIKMLREGDSGALYRFKREFRALADVQHPNLLRFGELYCEGGKWFFTMELVRGRNFFEYVRLDAGHNPDADTVISGSGATQDTEDEQETVDGRAPVPWSVQRAVDSAPLPLVKTARGFDEERLREAAKQLATAIAALHHAGRVHRDLKPANVLVRDDGHLVLLDFGLIEETSARDQLSRGLLVGTPAFMAPEQTDDAQVGPEADWYSFGVMLFLALTGSLPFRGSAPEILDSKCTRRAPRPGDLVADVPRDLDQLCHTLLERDPQRRPPVAEVLARLGVDPASAQPSLAASASGDTPALFVGRKVQLAVLERALASSRGGHRELVFVEGEPGVGKSALVRHFVAAEAMRQPSLVVLAGRCYEQESVPFKGFDTIIDSLSMYLAGLDERKAEALLLGGVRFLASVFPVLLRVPVVAKQVPPERAVDNPLGLRAHAFEQLRGILATIAERVPLVLFIDDLQWADKESVALLRALLTGGDAPACLVIATLRTHSLADGQDQADLSSLAALDPTVLSLQGLSREESHSLWTTLWRSERRPDGGDAERAFAALSDEAAGHPLFLSELVRFARTPHADGTMGARLQEVLWERVSALDEPARRFMETVALAGVPIKYGVLAEAAELDPAHSMQLLGALRSAQLIRLDRRGDERMVEPYHDRIREAVLQRMRAADGAPSERMLQLHLRLGRRLLDHSSESELASSVFTIVSHLNVAASLIETQVERRRLCELNLIAGRQAKLATAYETALEYIDRAMSLLPADPWQSAYELCRDLHIERLEAEYLTGHRDQAIAHFNELLPQLRSDEERASLYFTKITLDTSGGQLHDAIATARHGLAMFKVTLPQKAGAPSVLREYAALRWVQGKRPVPDLIRLPDLDDARLRHVTQLYIAMSPAAFFVDTNLLTVVLMRIARTSIKHGVNDVSAYGLAGYGLVLAGALGKPEQAYQFGQLALRLNERFRNHRIAAKLLVINGNYLTAWVRPWSEAIAQLREALVVGRQTGDTAYEVYASATLPIIVYNESAQVEAMMECNQSCIAIAHARRNETMEAIPIAFQRYCVTLRGAQGPRFSIGAVPPDQLAFRETLGHETTPVAIFYYFFLNAELHYLFGDIARAASFLAESDTLPAAIFSVPTTAEHCLFHALIAARQHDVAGFTERLPLRRRIGKCVNQLKRWAQSCPQNFDAQYHLAVAEQARVAGDSFASEAFADAIAAARRQGTLKREALALELAARFWHQQGDATRAAALKSEAIHAYVRWGAEAKADSLHADSMNK